ncbi:aldo/keto reductase [Candidatus Rhodoluna planktonica]|uniref:Alcohol dehydrogenase n=1 Tax=Candidatus Rhodoluna planktonica TaxID=535712 RepID=A0A1D9DXV7_9MICO|nr:aldo/keto reductase [Candidatus Rhodoluna planktonica]AOY55639.1 alcohol dehydrogenase [Candidatus Rhodoluna planktonica]
MTRITLPNTNLSVYPLSLGGNVFGWSADQDQSFAVLDAHRDLGGNFIDTADVYSEWVEGNRGGESESIIGNWMSSRGGRDQVVIATKVAKLSTRAGLSRANIIAACDDSLKRLKTDYIDLYYAHEDDQSVDLLETLSAFDELVTAGKIRYAAASNYSGARLSEALRVSAENNLTSYVALQNQYNLLERGEFETDAAPILRERGLSALPYYALASGFLTGKYQPGTEVDSVRAGGVSKYQNEQGWAVIAALGEIAAEQHSSISAVALAWLRQQDVVSTPIASARTIQQLQEIMPIVELSVEQLSKLSSASA